MTIFKAGSLGQGAKAAPHFCRSLVEYPKDPRVTLVWDPESRGIEAATARNVPRYTPKLGPKISYMGLHVTGR